MISRRFRFVWVAVSLAAALLPVSGICSDGAVVSWGRQVIGPFDMVDIVAVSGGDRHTLGLKSDGTVVAWGGNEHGQCNVPAQNAGFITIASGSHHGLVIRGFDTSDVVVSDDGAEHSRFLSIFPNPASGAQSFLASAVPFHWDGTDEQGRAVPASVYFGRMTYESGSVHNRIVRLR